MVAACGFLLFAFMFMVVGDVSGRYLFSTPINGTQEIGGIVLAFVVFMGWAASLANNQHIRVLLVVDRFPLRWRARMELLSLAVGMAMMIPIAVYSLSFAIDSYLMKEIGYTYAIPLYPGKFAFFMGSALLAIQFLVMFSSHLVAILSGKITEDQVPVVKEQS